MRPVGRLGQVEIDPSMSEAGIAGVLRARGIDPVRAWRIARELKMFQLEKEYTP